MFNWSNKNVVYVGAFSGLGLQCCQLLMKKQIKQLIVCSRRENLEMVKQMQAITPAIKVTFCLIDILERSSIERVVTSLRGSIGQVDVLINGVGVLADTNVETTIGVNLTGLINTTLLMLPLMDKTQSGRGGMVVNIASVYGLEPCGALSVYSAAKHGVIGFTRSLAVEQLYRKTGVAFVCICPGLTSTELMMNKGDLECLKWVPHTEELWNNIRGAKMQTAQQCAINILNIMDQWKNGGIYICDNGGMKEIVQPVQWSL